MESEMLNALSSKIGSHDFKPKLQHSPKIIKNEFFGGASLVKCVIAKKVEVLFSSGGNIIIFAYFRHIMTTCGPQPR